MSSDSSDDEDLDKLREAADTQFINDSMFDKKQATSTHALKVDKMPSLRRSKDEDEQFNLFRVSREFRGYVAKHLSKILDEVLQKKLRDDTNKDSHLRRKRRKSGVKLFRNSSHYIKVETPTSIPARDRQKPNFSKVPEDDPDDDKFESVAVSPDYVLSKKETESWSTRSKAPIYAYIKTNQGLILK